MLYFKNILIIIILGAATNYIAAQNIKVDAVLDTNIMLIGDQVDYRLQMQLPKNVPFLWPAFQDTLTGEIEIVKQSNIDTTTLKDGYLSIKQILTLTVFDSGYYLIPPVEFIYGNDYESIAETEPHLLNVFTVEVDTSKAIMPIKGPISAPLTFAEIWPWALLVIIILLIAGLSFYFLKKRKKKEPILFKKSKPKVPPHQIALDELERLETEKLWQRDLIKDYHTQLTDIIRTYIEGTFRIQAMEMTTWEIIHAFGMVKIEKENLEILREMLVTSDLVKFAKLNPMPDENNKSLTDAISFVKSTMIVKSTETKQENKPIDQHTSVDVVEA